MGSIIDNHRRRGHKLAMSIDLQDPEEIALEEIISRLCLCDEMVVRTINPRVRLD